MSYFIDVKKSLKERIKRLEAEKELANKALESLENIKYKFGDFIYTRDGEKGYITGSYTVNYITYLKGNQSETDYTTTLKDHSPPKKELTLEAFINNSDQKQVFYTCVIFEENDTGDYLTKIYNSTAKKVILQEDLVLVTDKTKILYEK